MIVVDRFHLAKSYRNELENFVKRNETSEKELSEEKYKELKGVMWGLRKKKENLTQEEDQSLQKVFQYSPILKLAYELCLELTDIFEEPVSKNQAKRKIKQWQKKSRKINWIVSLAFYPLWIIISRRSLITFTIVITVDS